MGSFISIVGDSSIPKNKRQDFEKKVLHVMDIGGMMRLEEVRIYDKSVYLLTRASVFDETCECYWASYNYFEEDMWEDAGYDPKTCCVYSNKVGWSVFNNVMAICHLLEELYSKGGCYVGGDLYMEPLEMVYWLNKEFGVKFDLDHRLDMVKIYHALKNDDCYGLQELSIDDLADYAKLYSGEVVFTESSRDKLKKELLAKGTPEEVEKFFSGKKYEFCSQENYTRYLLFILDVFTESPKYKYNFSTKDLVRCDSDDDRIYWWSEGAFNLSTECQDWLAAIREKHQQLMGDESDHDQDMVKKLIVLLERINEVYRNMYMFKDGFYDILAQAYSAEARAAVKLLEAICAQGEPKIKELLANNRWQSIRCREPRREMKRFLALLGNRELRKKTLAF